MSALGLMSPVIAFNAGMACINNKEYWWLLLSVSIIFTLAESFICSKYKEL